MFALPLLLLLAQPPASACGISDEPDYATTREHAVQVGGGAMYVGVRERRYLDALRGPMGETLQYKRTGSLPLDREGYTILDRYEVTYPGAEKPTVLFLDAYHFDDALMAPKGFTCAVPIGLNAPGPDPLLAADSEFKLAVEQGAAKEFAPISLDADGSGVHGVLFDRFRVTARAARAAAAAGTPIDPRQPPPGVMRLAMVAVAYPLRCGDREPTPPSGIDILPAEGPAPRRAGDLATGESLARLLPGISVPAGSMAATFQIDRPRPQDRFRITYAEGPCAPSNEVLLPVKYSGARPLNTPMPPLPDGQAATNRPVRLQAVIDLDGAARHVVYMGGPAALTAAAVDAVRSWTAEPARLNGAPVLAPVTLQVRFVPR